MRIRRCKKHRFTTCSTCRTTYCGRCERCRCRKKPPSLRWIL